MRNRKATILRHHKGPACPWSVPQQGLVEPCQEAQESLSPAWGHLCPSSGCSHPMFPEQLSPLRAVVDAEEV